MPLRDFVPRSVALLMPCGGPVEPRVIQSALNVISHSWSKGIQVRQIGMSNRTLVDDARNGLAKDFLDTECEWAFWVDSDMVLEPRTLDVLLRRAEHLGAKMTTGIYYQRGGNHIPVIGKRRVVSKDGKHDRDTEDDYFNHFIFPTGIGGQPFKIDVAGFGVCLIHRSVFEEMEYPYFQFLRYKTPGGEVRKVSEDFYFFVEAKKKGHQLWAVPELDCGHLAEGRVIRHKDMVVNHETVVERGEYEESLRVKANGEKPQEAVK